MTPVNQTIFGEGGNCLQAAVASLLDMEMDKVPHFISRTNWFDSYKRFLNRNGYSYHGQLFNAKGLGQMGMDPFDEDANVLGNDWPGVDGYFIGTVYSPGLSNFALLNWGQMPAMHAVIVNSKAEIVHDPNPRYVGVEYPLAKYLDYRGLLSVDLIQPVPF